MLALLVTILGRLNCRPPAVLSTFSVLLIHVYSKTMTLHIAMCETNVIVLPIMAAPWLSS